MYGYLSNHQNGSKAVSSGIVRISETSGRTEMGTDVSKTVYDKHPTRGD